MNSQQALIEDDRTSETVDGLKRALADNLFYLQGKFASIATAHDFYSALAYTVRDRIIRRWLNSIETYLKEDVRLVGYLSAEYLMGPHLENTIVNLGIARPVQEAVAACGLDYEELLAQEPEPGLGNGGLGRLAACYMDSMATLEIPAIGYGIRYQFGIFDQEIRNGFQVEVSDPWLRCGNVWELHRPARAQLIPFGGRTEAFTDEHGKYRVRWIPDQLVKAEPYDTPVPGYHTATTNILRLWTAEAPQDFDFQKFNAGDYLGAVFDAVSAENITKVLYPNDSTPEGRELRLKQQFFFTSASLRDAIRIHLLRKNGIETLHQKFALQMNDTHPSIGVAELMRLLVDDHGLDWEPAWNITRHVFSYTNHTLLPEALERWPLPLFSRLLPRHLEIIFEVNARFLKEVRERFPGDEARAARMSIIDESGERHVRMAHLATVGSHCVNGVAELHTKLLQASVLRDFAEFWPERFTNVTNGVTPRRWIVLSNPALAETITSKIGDGWVKRLDELRGLEKFLHDDDFRRAWRDIKSANKRRLAQVIEKTIGLHVDPASLFDVQVKRIHEYKRQHLNALFIITLYNRLRRNPGLDMPSRTFIFGGKAAPGYATAKLMIKLITAIGDKVNADPVTQDRLKVAFLPNFEVRLGQEIYPAGDLSEQISLAGKEASGTGNMKFAMNGAVTIGTLDGANIEIRQEVGDENFFLFGMTADQVNAAKPNYNPRAVYDKDPELKEAVDAIASGFFSGGDPGLFEPLLDSLLNRDEYMLFADYRSYVDAQERVSEAWRDTERWTTMSILNSARSGKFSSDRSIREYCERIWDVAPVPVTLDDYVQGDTLLREHVPDSEAA